MSKKLVLNTTETTVDGIDRYYCTFIPQKYIFKYGIIEDVIIGEVQKSDSGKVDIENSFIENSLFKKTIFDFAEKEIINDPRLIQLAKKQNKGWFYIVDQRTPTPDGRVPPYDIIGAFEVKDGRLSNFNANKNYRLKSDNGFTNLGDNLNIKFNAFLKKLLRDSAKS